MSDDLPSYVKTKPLRHQSEILERAKDKKFFALFWEMGLGKTKLMIDVASYLWEKKQIDGVLVVAPNSVYANWPAIELPIHMAAPYLTARYKTRGDKRRRLKEQIFLDPSWDRSRLRVLSMSYDSVRTDKGFAYAKSFCLIYRTMIVADESTVIKTHGAEISKRMKKLRDICHRAWIATGTPVAQSPFDIHSQIQFLDDSFWREFGLNAFQAFKSQFGDFKMERMRGGKQFPKLVQYKRLDQLNKMIEPISSRLLKEDSTVELPPKRYTFRTFEMLPEQEKLYETVRDDFAALLGGGETIDAPLAITRLLRMQQITSGHVTALEGAEDSYASDPYAYAAEEQLGLFDAQGYAEALEAMERDTPPPGGLVEAIESHADDVKPQFQTRKVVDLMPPSDNPRLKLLLEILAEREVKTIVFCRFRRDVDLICEALGPEASVRYDGSVKSRDREEALRRFREDEPCRVFVANVHALSMGVTLTMAKRTIYYSNSFSLEKRLQSEDRIHRLGQEDEVEIVDIAAEETIDEKIIEALRKKFDVAAQVTGDRAREWLT